MYLVELALVWGGLVIYMLFPFGEFFFLDKGMGFYDSSISVKLLAAASIVYSMFAVEMVRHLFQQKRQTKMWYVLNAWKTARKLDEKAWNHVRSFLVKFFFIPLMLPSSYTCMDQLLVLIGKIQASDWEQGLVWVFNRKLFHVLLYVEMFISVTIYTYGYLVESPKLNNQIRSVQPSLFGWVVCMVCYSPFFPFMAKVVPFPTDQMAFFINDTITFYVRLFILMVLCFKVYAIAVLGAKCSNLTNRGIVEHGPYGFIRHPHYISKLVIWWLTALPLIVKQPMGALAMFFWTYIYYLRAVTEENHLSEEEAYVNYLKRVKYRFIPGIL